jgi:hypothetical protein
MNMSNFDDIVLEYRQTYGCSIDIPFFLVNVLVEPDERGRILRGCFNVIKNNTRPKMSKSFDDIDLVTEQTIYRCGWCGNVVDYDGAELSNEVRNSHILVLQKYGDDICERVHGYCCENKKR